ncbi:MAG: recombinase family protein [Mycoplasmatales bacterium]
MLKNIIYTRVSTSKQKVKGESLEEQENRTRRYCKDNNILNPILYSDGGKSGGRKKKREFLDILVQEIKENKIKNLIVTTIDRLSRSNIDYLLMAELCKEYRVEMHILDLPININAPGGKIVHTVRAAMGEEERDFASSRTRHSYRNRLEKGVYPYSSHLLPLGISKGEDRKIYYNDDIRIVKEIFKLYEEGLKFTTITKIILEKYSNINMYRDRVERIIKNTIYYGYKEFEGKKYYLIKPIATEYNNIEIEKIEGDKSKIKAKRSRINYAHNYDLQGRVKYRVTNKLLYVQTKIKKNGLTYKYLYTSDGKYFNEKILIQMIDYYIKQEDQEMSKIKEEKQKRLNKLFINGNINSKEYDKLIDEINLKIDSYNALDGDIEVDDNYNVYFKLNDKQIEFNYKEELQDFRV